ncbi:MAG TPA: cupin domain-containing protein [Solirubrobacteraceae bacterium]|nr:cupin domain-containing protein [Solirubrobacteraceae bacterium]
MLEPGTLVRSPRGTVVEVLESSPDRLRIRRELPPATGRTPLHFHENGVERFKVLAGEASGRSGADMQRLREGDVLEVPVGAPHVHPHTATDKTAVIEHWIEPQPRFVQVYFPSWMAWLEDGRVNGQDEPTFLSVMSLMREGGGGTWLTGPPVAAQQALARALAPVAAARGYRAIT